MPEVLLSNGSTLDTSNDSIVIENLIEDIPGGRALDVTGVTDEVLKAGRVVIEETSSGNLKPAPISNGTYDATPTGHTVKGILVASILKTKAFASVLVRGTVNEEAAEKAAGLPPYLAAHKTALEPLVRFRKD